EAAAREARNESIVLDPALWAQAKAAQDARFVEDPWVNILRTHLNDHEGNLKIKMESLWVILDVTPARQDKKDAARIRQAMQRLGWNRNSAGTIKIDSNSVLGFYREGTGQEKRKLISATRSYDVGLTVRVTEENEEAQAAEDKGAQDTKDNG